MRHANILHSAKVLLTVPKQLQSLLQPSNHHRRITPAPPRRGIVQSPDIRPPLLGIRPQHSPIIGEQTIDFAFDIRRLRPDASRAGEPVDLVAELGEEFVRAIVVGFVGLFDFVSLVDGVDGLLDVPETVHVSVLC